MLDKINVAQEKVTKLKVVEVVKLKTLSDKVNVFSEEQSFLEISLDRVDTV